MKEAFKNIVFLFGAGVSIDAGCKTSKGILDDLIGTIKNPDTLVEEHLRKPFLEIYEFLQASLDYQHSLRNIRLDRDHYKSNIEDFILVLRKIIDKEFIIPYPLVGNWSDKILKWELQNENIFNLFLEFITKQLKEKWLVFDIAKANELVEPVYTFLKDTSAEEYQINIFTLNYDLIFESTLNTSDVTNINNGFTRKRWSGDFDAPNNESKINYYKLHGSLDWYYDADKEIIKSNKEHIVEDSPLIIFGEDSKMLSYDPFISLLFNFRKKLSEASLFVIIGYSFQDVYINNLLIQQVNVDDKKILVIDPCIKTSTKDFVEKIKIVQNIKSSSSLKNLSVMNENRVEIENIGAKEFFSKYFSNKAEKLIEKVAEITNGEDIF